MGKALEVTLEPSEMQKEFKYEIEIHNQICLKSPFRNEQWLGCPYPCEKSKSYNEELFRCNLCRLEYLRTMENEDGKFVFGNYHWRKWLNR